MSYAQIDSIILTWVQKHELSLFTSQEGHPELEYRNVYVSSNLECCQIWIDKPADGNIELHAAGVETEDDEEMRSDWNVPLVGLDSALENALVYVKNWLDRN